MVVRRAPTVHPRYSRVDDTDLGQDADHIELLSRSVSKPPQESDKLVESERRHEALKSPFADVNIAPSAHDDPFLDPPSRPEEQQYPTRYPKKRRFLTGWRVGALVSLIGATLVAVMNITVTLWVWKNPRHEINDSIGTIFNGSCDRVRQMNVFIHLFVNVLSTLLLGAGNYCMQVLSSPSREELIRAHAQRYWLHIAVPSLRNLFRIGKDRALLWLLLALSSGPLHLLFNSVVFSNLQANRYVVVPTMEDWLNGGNYNTSRFVDINETDAKNFGHNIDYLRVNFSDETTASQYQNVSVETCFNTYQKQYVSEAGNVYLVQEDPTVWRNLSLWVPVFNKSGQYEWETAEKAQSDLEIDDPFAITQNSLLPFISTPNQYPSNGWRCPSRALQTCNVDNIYEVPRNRSAWEPYESPLKYCMIQKVEEVCKLQFSFHIATAVIVANIIKTTCIALTLFCYRKHAALITIGDAVASFLDKPDPETKGRCLHSRTLMQAEWNWELSNDARKGELGVEPERFILKGERWAQAPSRLRWFATYFLFSIGLISAFICIHNSLTGLPKSISALWKIGFGTIDGRNLLNIGTSLIGGVLLANLPQAILSYLYLTFNALYTNMFVAHEWSTYTHHRKPLRVTSPAGKQRDTYYLNVPFRYAIPMTVLSGLFHWLTSQSIFMVQITVLDSTTNKVDSQISTCGYSPMAIILATILGASIAIGGIVVGRFRYPAGMPLAGSCSAAISAACHPAAGDDMASLGAVKWGATTQGSVEGGWIGGRTDEHGEREEEDGSHEWDGGYARESRESQRGKRRAEPVGHCAFSSLRVEMPIPGHLYA